MLEYNGIVIETADPGGCYYGGGGSHWQDSSNPSSTPVEVERQPAGIKYDFLLEKHHSLYGRPWVVGKYYFDYMLSRGLLPSHKVLDFGCGAGRLSIKLIPYLNTGNYYGMDSHLESLEALASYEIPYHSLADKRPRLLHNGTLVLDYFNESFDWITDLFVTYHLEQEQRESAYRKMAELLNAGGRIVTLLQPDVSESLLAASGLRLTHEDLQPCPLLEGHEGTVTENPWFIYQKI